MWLVMKKYHEYAITCDKCDEVKFVTWGTKARMWWYGPVPLVSAAGMETYNECTFLCPHCRSI